MFNFKHSVRSFSQSLKPACVLIALAVSMPQGFQQKAIAQVASVEVKTSPGPDIMTLVTGEQFQGKLVSEANGAVTFHSDGAGNITLTWDKIKSIRTSQRFALIRKGQHISRKTSDSDVPRGVVSVEEGKVRVSANTEGSAQEISQADVQNMIEEGAYTKEVHSNLGWGQGWGGTLSAGLADVEATQNSRTFTGAANFVRTIPNASWLDPRNRTTASIAAAYGSVSQPGSVTTKTNIVHADVEHDLFLSPRLYALVDASFDHNYSQGLDLQQIYGGGLGYVLIKTAKQELDLKGDIHYERQSFGFTPGVVPPVQTPSRSLVGLDAGDTYMAKLSHGIVFNQGLVVTPAFNKPSDFSALVTAGLVFPVYKRLGFNLSALDDFLNDPAFGSKQNSFQFSAGLTYTLK